MWLHLFLVKIHSLEPSPAFQHCLWENLYQLTLPVSGPSTMLPLGNNGTMLQVDQLMRHNPEIWIYVLIWHNSYTFLQQNTKVKMRGATALFPCGVGCVASCLLGKLVGLYRRIIIWEIPWKVHDQLWLADTLMYRLFSALSLILFVNCNAFYKTEFLIYEACSKRGWTF